MKSGTQIDTIVDRSPNPPSSPNGLDVGTTGALDFEVLNNAVTGTTLNKFVCDDGTGTNHGIVCSHTTAATNQPLGIAVAGLNVAPGTTGSTGICNLGFCLLTMDGAATAGHFVQSSTSVDGDGTDAGSTEPANGQPYYYIAVGNAGAGTNAVIRRVTPQELSNSSVGGKGHGTQFNINGTPSQPIANVNGTTPAADPNNIALTLKTSTSGNTTNFIGESLAGAGAATTIGGPIYATTYGVKANVQVIRDATFTATSQNVSCPNSDCTFTSADVGKIVFGTSPGGHTYDADSPVDLPQGTITTVTDSNHIVVSIAATNSKVGTGWLFYGNDDTAALTSAWSAVTAGSGCQSLVLPAGKMFIQQGVFDTGSTACTGGNSNRTQNDNRGLAVWGQGRSQTYLIPTPNFDFTTCVNPQTASQNQATVTQTICLFGFENSSVLHDFTVWGGGNDLAGGASACSPNGCILVYAGFYTSLQNVNIMGWGAKNSNLIGLYVNGQGDHVETLTVDSAGATNCQTNASATVFTNVVCFGAGSSTVAGTNLKVNGGSLISHGGLYGSLGGHSGDSNILVQVGPNAAGSVSDFYSFGDALLESASSGGQTYGLTTSAGVHLYTFNAGTPTNFQNPNPTNGAHVLSGGNLIAHNSFLIGSTDSLIVDSGGNFIDEGNNVFTGAIVNSGTITYYPKIAGDFGGTGTSPTVTNLSHVTNNSLASSGLATTGVSGSSCGDSTHSCGLTYNPEGQLTAVTNNGISGGAATPSGVSSTTPVTVSAAVTTDQQLMELSLAAGYLNTLGQAFWFNAAGVYSLAAAQTPTLNFKVKLCTVSGCGSGTVVTLATMTSAATTAAVTNNNWNINLLAATAATGATGNLEIHGNLVVDLGALGTAADTVYADTNTAVSGNISLTGALFVDFTVATSTGNAGNSITQRLGAVEPQVASAVTGTAPIVVSAGNVSYVPDSVGTHNSTTQSIPNNATTAVTFDTNDWDNDTLHSTVTNPSRITFKVAGVYACSGFVELQGSGGGNSRYVGLRINASSTLPAQLGGWTPNSVAHADFTPSFQHKFAVNDFLELVVFQDSGGALNIGVDYHQALQCTWISGG